MGLKSRDFLTMMEYTAEELWFIIKKAAELKRDPQSCNAVLQGKHVALLFQKPSTRTRVSFEVAVNQLGGSSIFLPSGELQLTRGESLADTARVLERYVAAVVTRFASHGDVEELARYCGIPVINGLSDLHHPCQALADVFTLHEKGKDLKKLKLAWVGDGNNVCNSLMIAMAKLGGTMMVASPEGCKPPNAILATVKAESERSGGRIQVVHDPEEAVEGADVVYTDTFVSMGKEHERDTRLKMFLPRFQVTRTLLKKAHPNFVFMHCLPAHRGEEVEAEVIDGPHSIVWDQAENRLHLQKSLLTFIV